MPNILKNTQRLTNILKRAEKGGKFTIGFLGGSITQGCNPTFPENAYVERVTSWFKKQFPNTDIQRINAGVGATGSLIGVHRAERDIIVHKPDLVFIDFAANDVTPKKNTNISYESLIRKLVTSLPDSAFVEIFMTLDTGESAAEEEGKIADHYHIPVINYREEIFSKINAGVYSWEDIETDEVHPNDRGHGIIASLIEELMVAALNQKEDPNFIYEIPEKNIFGAPYVEGKLIEFKDLKIIEEVGFKATKENFRTINTGYEAVEGAGKVSLTCEVEGKNVFLLYVNGIEKERAKVDIKVNGKKLDTLDTFFENGWGNYPDTYPLFTSDTKQKVIIEINMCQDEKATKLNLLGILVS